VDETRVTIAKGGHDAVIFDLDGVVTQTAAVHAAAWKRLFDAYLAERAARPDPGGGGASDARPRAGGGDDDPLRPFDLDADYARYVDGKPRYDGVRDFLASRGIDLPWGDPSDPPDRETVCGLGNRKNGFFNAEVREHGVKTFPSTIDLIHRLHDAGIKVGLMSSSKNTAMVLDATGITDLFEVRVDGVVAADVGLPGKPDPAMYLEAAHRLGVDAARSVVVEDALSGVEAGRRGGFGLVIGVDRLGQADALRASGADVVVDDLAEVGVGA
jgi:beta-phosphoglucomutase family hydrolase